MEQYNAKELMSEAKFFEAYSRYNDDLGRYETWDEAVNRVMNMHREYYSEKMTDLLSELLSEAETSYRAKEFLGAQRALQFGGKQLLAHQARLYNCASSYADRPSFYGETFYLMLCGTGVGFSVQKHHNAKLPPIAKRTKAPKTFVVPDSIEGWQQAVDILTSSFFVGGGKYPEYEGKKIYFDLEKIRPKGAYVSGGFKAPGPDGLRVSLEKIEAIFERVLSDGRDRLKPIESYDIVMFIADAVLSGGIRRAATICMFSWDDEEMIKAKTGSWFVDNPQRGRSNNSAVLLRGEVTFDHFKGIMESVKHSGEPGFIWVDDLDITLNPCCEIGMYPQTSDGRSGFQMCNLTEINGGLSKTKEMFLHQCKIASIMGTIQAGYTQFKHVSPETREIVEKEALIGVSITGWMNNPDILFDKETMKEGAEEVKKWNRIVAELIGINPAARTTTVKPSGNASVLLGTASGIHGEHSPRYLRHVQFNKDTEVAQLFMKENPDMCEDSVYNRERDITVAFPVISDEGSIYKRDLLGVKQLSFVKLAQENWVEHGTNVELCVKPYIRHNVSNTITVDDWDEVTQYIYDNRYAFCGVSLMAASGDKAYPQAPFTDVLTHIEIIEKYGEESLFTSALIEAGLAAFNGDLWNGCNTALGFGEELKEGHEHLLKRDFVRRFKKFARSFYTFTDEDVEEYNSLVEEFNSISRFIQVVKEKLENDPEFSLSEEDFVELNNTIVETTERVQAIKERINVLDIPGKIVLAEETCANCLKDIYNLHKWWRIQKKLKPINWASDLKKKEYVDLGSLAGQACAGGACEVAW